MKAARYCRGLSIVELLVGTAVGLLVVAAASTLVSHHVRESRALVTETRLTQDLRSAADIVARDLRRAGYWGHAASGVAADSGAAVMANPYLAIAPDASASDAVRFHYSRDPVENDVVDGNEQFGVRLRNGAIELQLGDANWQALTDPATLTVTAFGVDPQLEETSLASFCAAPCATGSTTCPPRQQVRRLVITISGHAVANPALARSVQAVARVRNAGVVGSCES